MKACPICGAVARDEDETCGICGTGLSGVLSASMESVPNVETKRVVRKPAWNILALALPILLVASGLVIMTLGGQSFAVGLIVVFVGVIVILSLAGGWSYRGRDDYYRRTRKSQD